MSPPRHVPRTEPHRLVKALNVYDSPTGRRNSESTLIGIRVAHEAMVECRRSDSVGMLRVVRDRCSSEGRRGSWVNWQPLIEARSRKDLHEEGWHPSTGA